MHARPPAGGADRARDEIGPDLDVALRVADDGRLARRAGGGVHAHDLLARHGEQAERIVVAQVGLRGEGKLREVLERPEIVGMHARRVEARACNAARSRRRGATSPARRSSCSAAISSRRGGLDRLEARRGGRQIEHVLRPCRRASRESRGEWPRNSAIVAPASSRTVTS